MSRELTARPGIAGGKPGRRIYKPVILRGSRETDEARRAAEARGETLSAFIRKACRELLAGRAAADPDLLTAVVEELVRLRTDLNRQAATLAHTGDDADLAEMRALRAELRVLLKRFRPWS